MIRLRHPGRRAASFGELGDDDVAHRPGLTAQFGRGQMVPTGERRQLAGAVGVRYRPHRSASGRLPGHEVAALEAVCSGKSGNGAGLCLELPDPLHRVEWRHSQQVSGTAAGTGRDLQLRPAEPLPGFIGALSKPFGVLLPKCAPIVEVRAIEEIESAV